jgi:hypothetical protein
MDPGYSPNGTAPLLIIEAAMPRAGTIRNLFVRHNAAAGNGNPVTYTVMKNGVATLLTVSGNTGVVGQASDLVNTVAVVQGDRIAVRITKAAAIGGGAVRSVITMELA